VVRRTARDWVGGREEVVNLKKGRGSGRRPTQEERGKEENPRHKGGQSSSMNRGGEGKKRQGSEKTNGWRNSDIKSSNSRVKQKKEQAR